jgi:DNA-binding NarL/FixJ family response regulator
VAQMRHTSENGERTRAGVNPLEDVLRVGPGPLDGPPTMSLSGKLAQPLAEHPFPGPVYGNIAADCPLTEHRHPEGATNDLVRDGGSPSPPHTMHETLGRNTPLTHLGSHREHLQGVADPGNRLPIANLLVVDDCTLHRENLATVLAANGAALPAVAWDLPSLCTSVAEATPDIVLLNRRIRDVLRLFHSVREMCPRAKVIVFGISEDDESGIVACAEAGVAGYHLRTESLDTLLVLISKVFDGESSCSPKVSAILLKRLSTLAAQQQPGATELVLTTREIQILRMLEMGLSNRDIADRLCIALHTVKNHVHSVLSKLGVSTRAEAAAFSRTFRYTQGLGTELV